MQERYQIREMKPEVITAFGIIELIAKDGELFMQVVPKQDLGDEILLSAPDVAPLRLSDFNTLIKVPSELLPCFSVRRFSKETQVCSESFGEAR